MNQTEQVLLQAIQKSLWNTDIEFPADTDWDAVLKEAEDQAVLGLVIDIAPKDVRDTWKSRAGAVTANFVRILHYQQQLCELFKANDIPLVILKGTAAAVYYPNPAQRSMGDIDYLVPEKYFDRAKALLSENGYSVEEDPRYARHIDVTKDHVSFEQHRFFSDGEVEIEQYIKDGMASIEKREIFGVKFPMLPRLANGLVLLGHMVHHLKTGLGLRQVIDWMMYVNSELTDAFWAETFEPAAKEAGLDKVAVIATEMCKKYLGLPAETHWCEDGDEQLCRELMESLLSSGNFDRKRGRGSAVEKVTSNFARKGIFRYLQYAGEYNWKAYHKHKWLKPFAWAYQIGRYARQGLKAKRSGTQLKEDIARGRRRTELLQKLNISTDK
ncbi:MAG: nucleotidyltransferase family protein [Lachnospiraceae bacterium]|nr:nucleotidyltransferase family protein [Lachnospiraceae bacterium]